MDGFFPVVLGGDHSQAIGSISGLKKALPDTKIIWMDAHIDANTPASSPSGNAHGMPLAYLAGLVPSYEHWKCMDLSKELCYFGIRSYEPEELQLIQDNNVLVFESGICQQEHIDDIERVLDNYFSRKHNASNNKFWISFDIDSVDAREFVSTGTTELGGLTLEFVTKFFK